MMGLRACWVVVLLALLAGCSNSSTPAYKEQMYVFGTLVEVAIWGEEPERAQQAITQLGQQFQQMHHDWHPWEPGLLYDLNQQMARGEPVAVPPQLLPLITRARTLSQQSGGLFNPALGRMVQLWGFADHFFNATQPPPQAAIERLLAQHPSMADITLEQGMLTSQNPANYLDFGGFAKGYAVDLAIESLRQMGIENAIVNAGGDLRAIGRHGERPWRIGVRHPREQGIIASLEIQGDESVFTSGDYERYFEYQGRRYHHIIDPRSGYPAQGLSSVTILHQDAATADAAATALLVAGKQWPQVAKAMGIRQVMVIDDQLTVTITPELAERIHFEQTPEKLELRSL